MPLRAGELEYLITVDNTQVGKAEKDTLAAGKRIEKNAPKVKMEADTSGFAKGFDQVTKDSAAVAKTKAVAKIDADITRAESLIGEIQDELTRLDTLESSPEVDADIAAAKSQLKTAQGLLDDLEGAKATMEVDADTSSAEEALGGASEAAGEAGTDAGENFGKNIVAALASIPIAGAVVGVATAAASALVDAFNDGLQVEVRQDRLQALTGITEPQAAQFGRTAAEAYANNFGDSIEGNMDATRLALQSGLLNPESTRADSQLMIQSLTGLADAMGEEVLPITQAVSTMLRNGLAKNGQEAFDILAAGQREGVNLNEDLLETFGEYSPLFKGLGLDGKESLGLLSQGLKGGARDADFVADALKEFQIRASEGGEEAVKAFDTIGLSGKEMTRLIAEGGPGARDALEQTLVKLREMEPGAERTAAAVALFGTKAEDLGDSLYSLDLTTAVDQLGQVEGAAQSMFDTLADNDASKMETARRNIEVALDGMKGALAAAFAEPLGDMASFVAENRGPIMQFLLDIANAALDMADAAIEGSAGAVEAFGNFAAGVGPSIAMVIDNIADLYVAFDQITPGDQGSAGFREWADTAIEGIAGVDEKAFALADTMREDLGGAVDTARTKLNEFGDPIVNEAYLHDTMTALATAVGQVGYQLDGVTPLMQAYTTSQDGSTVASKQLQDQIAAATTALNNEAVAAAAAGETQDELSARYTNGTAALMEQLRAMGLTDDQARELIASYGAIPESENTQITSDAVSRNGEAKDLAVTIKALPDGSFTVVASGLASALSSADSLNRTLNTINGKVATAYVVTKQQGQAAVARGAYMEFYADGGLRTPEGRGLTRMQNYAQMVPQSTWRVVGDRSDVAEAYVPMDGSARSLAIAMEMIRRWPGGFPQLMASGGISASGVSGPTAELMAPTQTVNETVNLVLDGKVLTSWQRTFTRAGSGGR